MEESVVAVWTGAIQRVSLQFLDALDKACGMKRTTPTKQMTNTKSKHKALKPTLLNTSKAQSPFLGPGIVAAFNTAFPDIPSSSSGLHRGAFAQYAVSASQPLSKTSSSSLLASPPSILAHSSILASLTNKLVGLLNDLRAFPPVAVREDIEDGMLQAISTIWGPPSSDGSERLQGIFPLFKAILDGNSSDGDVPKEEILAVVRLGHIFWATLVPWLEQAVSVGVFGKPKDVSSPKIDEMRRIWEEWVRTSILAP